MMRRNCLPESSAGPGVCSVGLISAKVPVNGDPRASATQAAKSEDWYRRYGSAEIILFIARTELVCRGVPGWRVHSAVCPYCYKCSRGGGLVLRPSSVILAPQPFPPLCCDRRRRLILPPILLFLLWLYFPATTSVHTHQQHQQRNHKQQQQQNTHRTKRRPTLLMTIP